MVGVGGSHQFGSINIKLYEINFPFEKLHSLKFTISEISFNIFVE